MFLGRFKMPLGSRYRFYPDAQLDQGSAAVAMETTPPTTSTIAKLSARLKHLSPLRVLRQLNQRPSTGCAKLELDFADYLAMCDSRQRYHSDANGAVNDVSMGT